MQAGHIVFPSLLTTVHNCIIHAKLQTQNEKCKTLPGGGGINGIGGGMPDGGMGGGGIDEGVVAAAGGAMECGGGGIGLGGIEGTTTNIQRIIQQI